MSNPNNQHTAFFGSKRGAVTGSTVKGNCNVQRGGNGYGFNPKGPPQFGIMPIKEYRGCGISSSNNLGAAKQHAPTSAQKGGAGLGACSGCGGTAFYGYKGQNDAMTVQAIRSGVNNYPPFTTGCHSQCGNATRGGHRRRRRRRRSKRKKRRGGRKKSRRRRARRRRGGSRKKFRGGRRQRGGYYQFGADIPSSPGYATPTKGGNWELANPPPYARNNACGTGSCVDNYNHYTGKGSTPPITDQDVSPTPRPTKIVTPNTKAQCGGRRSRKRRKKKKKTFTPSPLLKYSNIIFLKDYIIQSIKHFPICNFLFFFSLFFFSPFLKVVVHPPVP